MRCLYFGVQLWWGADRHTWHKGPRRYVEDEEKIVGGLETECPWDAARELYGHSDAGGIAGGGNPEGCEVGGDSSGPWRDARDRGQHWDPAAQ